MKLFAKLMLAALVIGLLLPFTILKDENGNTMMNFSDFKLPDFKLPGLPDSSRIIPSSGKSDGKDIFYKWFDAEGNVQFTTEPPPEGVEFTAKGYDPNTNVIQAVKLPSEEAEADTDASSQKKIDEPEDLGNPYSKEQIEKLFEDANNIEKLLNQRIQNQESALNQ